MWGGAVIRFSIALLLFLLISGRSTFAQGEMDRSVTLKAALNAPSGQTESIDIGIYDEKSGSDVLKHLPKIQKRDLKTGEEISTFLVGTKEQLGERPYPNLKGHTYTILVPSNDSRSQKEIDFEKVRKRSYVFATVRTALTGVMYFYFFPGWQAGSITLLNMVFNYFWAEPEKWNNVQMSIQERIYRIKGVDWVIQKGLHRNVVDAVSRVSFATLHGIMFNAAALGILGSSISSNETYLFSLLFGTMANSAWDETLNKWSNVPGSEKLTKSQFVNLTFARNILFIILNPMIQAGYGVASIVGGTLLTTGLGSFFNPALIIKARDILSDLEEFNLQRRKHTTLGLSCSITLSR